MTMIDKKENILDAWILVEQLSEGNFNYEVPKELKQLYLSNLKNKDWGEEFIAVLLPKVADCFNHKNNDFGDEVVQLNQKIQNKKAEIKSLKENSKQKIIEDELKNLRIDLIEKAKEKHKTLEKEIKSEQALSEKEKKDKDKTIKKIDKNLKAKLCFFINVFKFEEVIKRLKELFDIKQDIIDEDINYSGFKFSTFIQFEFDFLTNTVKFLENDFFQSISGYIHEKGALSDIEAIKEIERDEKNKWHEKIKDSVNFNEFAKIMIEFLSSIDMKTQLYFGALTDTSNLHSFFIDDLNRVKNETKSIANIERYFNGFDIQNRKFLENGNKELIKDILQPKNYPLGRFPTSTKYNLSLMQQIAVNLALTNENQMRSVNGPPGTGKTTLLKDIFADLVVQQAYEMTKLETKSIKHTENYFGNSKIGILPESISDKEIIVASSNNGAVQNIVKELPKKEFIDKEFSDLLKQANYFIETSNKVKDKRNKKLILSEKEKWQNWGMFSLEGGNKNNIEFLLMYVESMLNELNSKNNSNSDVYQEFSRLYEKVKKKQEEAENYKNDLEQFDKLSKQKLKLENELLQHQMDSLKQYKQYETHSLFMQNIIENVHKKEKIYQSVRSKVNKTSLLAKLFFKTKNKLQQELSYLAQLDLEQAQQHKLLAIQKQQELQQKINFCTQQIENTQTEFKDINTELNQLNQNNLASHKTKKINALDFNCSNDDFQKSNPWFDDEFRKLQSELFISALKVRKQFLYDNKKSLKAALNIWKNKSTKELIIVGWHWINLAIPVISTTFASFGRMFSEFGADSIGNVFIDEAGQALPQASVGAIYRSKKVMVVGDPAQIPPVLTLDSNVLKFIRDKYSLSETFLSANTSTQTLVDRASQFGFQKNEKEWIGIPLWVHRRSERPMFTISNEISYNGLMVQGKEAGKDNGLSKWYDVRGEAEDKYVEAQSKKLTELLIERCQEESENEIFIISPFKNVENKIKAYIKSLEDKGFYKNKDGYFLKLAEKEIKLLIGTVHAFQGKEANVVYFVLGADEKSQGAAKWAFSTANIMNVAATRAKKEFYVIGDKNLYVQLGCEVANKSIEIIDEYQSNIILNHATKKIHY